MVVGGGCYGRYYVRQLTRAARAGAVEWSELVVVDRDGDCLVAGLPTGDRPTGLRLEVDTWDRYFTRFLGEAAGAPAAAANDAVVPSPLMPHLMAEWLLRRARERWPARDISVVPLGNAPAVPWQMTGADNTHFVSFAEWICPINCVEPARCPATKGERTWSLPTALSRYAADEASVGRPVEGPFIFHCSHRTYGVGMIDVADVLAANAALAERGALGPMSFLVGTTSHCHGALQKIELGPL